MSNHNNQNTQNNAPNNKKEFKVVCGGFVDKKGNTHKFGETFKPTEKELEQYKKEGLIGVAFK